MPPSPAPAETLVQVHQLSKSYKAQKAVDCLSLNLLKGEIVALMGPNGAGKSTLLKMLVGLLRPSSGKIYFQGQALDPHSSRLRRQIGYLPEDNPLYADLYVREFLSFTGKIFGIPQPWVEETLEKVGLKAQQHKKISQLSKGYRQRLGLARALLHKPDFLVLDEPTTGLDPLQILTIRDVIKESARAQTILLSTHWVQEVEALADRVLILQSGKLAADFYRKDFSGRLETHFKALTEKRGDR